MDHSPQLNTRPSGAKTVRLQQRLHYSGLQHELALSHEAPLRHVKQPRLYLSGHPPVSDVAAENIQDLGLGLRGGSGRNEDEEDALEDMHTLFETISHELAIEDADLDQTDSLHREPNTYTPNDHTYPAHQIEDDDYDTTAQPNTLFSSSFYAQQHRHGLETHLDTVIRQWYELGRHRNGSLLREALPYNERNRLQSRFHELRTRLRECLNFLDLETTPFEEDEHYQDHHQQQHPFGQRQPLAESDDTVSDNAVDDDALGWPLPYHHHQDQLSIRRAGPDAGFETAHFHPLSGSLQSPSRARFRTQNTSQTEEDEDRLADESLKTPGDDEAPEFSEIQPHFMALYSLPRPVVVGSVPTGAK